MASKRERILVMQRRKTAAKLKTAAALENLRPEEAAVVLDQLLCKHPELKSEAEELATTMMPAAFGRLGKPASAYQLQVLLNGSQPPIWRRILVPGTANLSWLHTVLQVTMGWTNSHLHQFICGEHTYSDPLAHSEPYEGDPPVLDEGKFTVSELLTDIHKGLVYEYDFGDSWEHIVTVEKILPMEASVSAVAVCMAGAGACPPEDCGGIGGYDELLKALKNRKHPEHQSMKQWLGRPFDPEAFDVMKTNHWLRKLKWPRVTEGQLGKLLMARDGSRQ
jgi:hypothetical protein